MAKKRSIEPIDLGKIIDERKVAQLKQAANDPSLSGAADLSNPLIEMARRFIGEVAVTQPIALVLVAQTPNGQLMMAGDAAGGPIHLLGLLQFGISHVSSRFVTQPSTPKQEA